MGQELARKITVKTVCGALDFEKIQAAKKLHLFDVIGIANKATTGTSEHGSFIKLHGNFKAINAESGEMTVSPVCILPGNFGEMVAVALEKPESQGAQFGFRVSAKYDKDSVTKYVYTVETLMAPSESDPLLALEKQLSGRMLAAPDAKKDDKKDPKK